MHIAPYAFAQGFGAHDPDRRASSSSTASSSTSWRRGSRRSSLTLVPLAIYFKDGRAKVELALAKGRRKGDQRQAMAERDAAREMAVALGRQRKGMR